MDTYAVCITLPTTKSILLRSSLYILYIFIMFPIQLSDEMSTLFKMDVISLKFRKAGQLFAWTFNCDNFTNAAPFNDGARFKCAFNTSKMISVFSERGRKKGKILFLIKNEKGKMV